MRRTTSPPSSAFLPKTCPFQVPDWESPLKGMRNTRWLHRDGLAQSMRLYLFLTQLRDSVVIENWISGVRQAWLNIPQLLKAKWSLRGRFLICKIRMKMLVLAHCSLRRTNWNKSPEPLSQPSHTLATQHSARQARVQACLALLWPLRPLCLWGFPGKSTGVGYHFLLQGIFLTQGLNSGLLHWQADFLPLSRLGSPLSTVTGL